MKELRSGFYVVATFKFRNHNCKIVLHNLPVSFSIIKKKLTRSKSKNTYSGRNGTFKRKTATVGDGEKRTAKTLLLYLK